MCGSWSWPDHITPPCPGILSASNSSLLHFSLFLLSLQSPSQKLPPLLWLLRRHIDPSYIPLCTKCLGYRIILLQLYYLNECLFSPETVTSLRKRTMSNIQQVVKWAGTQYVCRVLTERQNWLLRLYECP
jgi:hypothetical protein